MKKTLLFLGILFSLVFLNAQNAPQVNPTADRAPQVSTAMWAASLQNQNQTREIWDIIFDFYSPIGAQVAVCSDGTNFYTASWNPGFFPPTFYRYEIDGSNPVGFEIPGVALVRSLTYDGQYFYAGNGGNNIIYKLNLATQTLVGTINCGLGNARHLTYDPTLDGGNGGFWCGDWYNLGAISMTGTVVVPNMASMPSIYGSAFDNLSDPQNPCLWLNTQDGAMQTLIHKFDINTLSMTNVTYDYYQDVQYPGIMAGGACLFPYNDERLLLMINVQATEPGNRVIAYELAMKGDVCDPVTNLEAEVQGTDVKLTWDPPADLPDEYKVYLNTTPLGTTNDTYYVVRNLADGIHKFAVEAIFDGCFPKKVTIDVRIKSRNPITNLQGNCEGGTLTLTWDEPDAKNTDEIIVLQWSGENGDGIGTGSVCELWPANRWTPEDLEEAGVFTGMELTKVAFFPLQPNATWTLMVWQGGHWGSAGDRDPGTELYSQVVTPNYGSWNEITLSPPVEIDATQELWIGYKMQATSGYPAGCDNGPMKMSKGNINWDGFTGLGWCHMSDLNGSLVYNWNVRGTIEGEAGVIEVTNYDIYQDDSKFATVDAPATSYTTANNVEGDHNYCVVAVYENGAQSMKVCEMIECIPCQQAAEPEGILNLTTVHITWKASPVALGYQVRRNGITTTVIGNEFYDTGVFEHGGEYIWTIYTVCDELLSEPVEVKLICNKINEIDLTAFTIVPNPAKNDITVSAGIPFQKVEIVNFLGQTVLSQSNDSESARIDVSNLTNGVYFVRVASEYGSSVKKFVKQ